LKATQQQQNALARLSSITQVYCLIKDGIVEVKAHAAENRLIECVFI
jgi:hypothetical protein